MRVRQLTARGATWHTKRTMAARNTPMEAMPGSVSPSKGGIMAKRAMSTTATMKPMMRLGATLGAAPDSSFLFFKEEHLRMSYRPGIKSPVL